MFQATHSFPKVSCGRLLRRFAQVQTGPAKSSGPTRTSTRPSGRRTRTSSRLGTRSSKRVTSLTAQSSKKPEPSALRSCVFSESLSRRARSRMRCTSVVRSAMSTSTHRSSRFGSRSTRFASSK